MFYQISWKLFFCYFFSFFSFFSFGNSASFKEIWAVFIGGFSVDKYFELGKMTIKSFIKFSITSWKEQDQSTSGIFSKVWGSISTFSGPYSGTDIRKHSNSDPWREFLNIKDFFCSEWYDSTDLNIIRNSINNKIKNELNFFFNLLQFLYLP